MEGERERHRSLVRIGVHHSPLGWDVTDGRTRVTTEKTWPEAMVQANRIASRWRANNAGWLR